MMGRSERNGKGTDSSATMMADVMRDAGVSLFDRLVAVRRSIHRRPELAFNEIETARLVSEELTRIGIPHQTGVGGTGIVGYLDGGSEGPTVLLRADMDALPITERNEVPFRSEIPGVMHACGHDSHVASLLGAAEILHGVRDRLQGRVRLLFQPAEEKVPGGAMVMLDEGVLDGTGERPPVDVAFGQHVRPDLPTGTIGVRAGAFMAASDTVTITVHGQGGHAAEPHRLSCDPVYAAAQILTALQSVISRNRPPDASSVLSFGRISGGDAPNVIPEQVVLSGTFRSMDDDWRQRGHALINRVATGTAAALGGRAEVEIGIGYPTLVNDHDESRIVREAAAEFVGEGRVIDLDRWYVAEDFARYLQRVPGCFYTIGTGNPTVDSTHGLHTDRFTIDEEALRTAPAFLAYLAWYRLDTSRQTPIS